MSRARLVAGAFCAMAALGVTLAPDAEPSVAPEAGLTAAQDPGQAVFEGKGNCFTCHQKSGQGTPLAPDLTDDAWVNFEERPTQEQVEELVRTGIPQPVQHPAPMPPMGGASLTDQEITEVARYVLSLSDEG